MILVQHNNGVKAHDVPLSGKDWIIRFEDSLCLEMTIRAYRDPSDAYVRRRVRAILRGQELDKGFDVIDTEIAVTSELFLEGGLCAARSVLVRRSK